jgi:DNA-binding MarR family transcriptional regulator
MSHMKEKHAPAKHDENEGRRVRKEQPAVQSSLDQSIGFAIRKAYQIAIQGAAGTLKRFNVRPKEYAVMVLIDAKPGQTQSALSLAYGIQRTNIVALLTSLEERQLVQRRKVDGDRRSFALHLTKQGEKLLQEMKIAHRRYEEMQWARLGARKSRRLLELLHEYNGKSRLAR